MVRRQEILKEENIRLKTQLSLVIEVMETVSTKGNLAPTAATEAISSPHSLGTAATEAISSPHSLGTAATKTILSPLPVGSPLNQFLGSSPPHEIPKLLHRQPVSSLRIKSTVEIYPQMREDHEEQFIQS